MDITGADIYFVVFKNDWIVTKHKTLEEAKDQKQKCEETNVSCHKYTLKQVLVPENARIYEDYKGYMVNAKSSRYEEKQAYLQNLKQELDLAKHAHGIYKMEQEIKDVAKDLENETTIKRLDSMYMKNV